MDPIYSCEKGALYQGDCRKVLKEFPDASVDSLVTDPPAGIEFMGKQWDAPKAYETGFTKDGIGKGFLLPTKSSRNPTCINCGGEKRRRLAQPERQCTCDTPDFNEVLLRGVERDRFIAFLQEALTECLRILKPGGYALVWSIPRTSHWTATALENAGFEVRDCIYNIKDRSVEVQTFLDSLTIEQLELLLCAEPTDTFMLCLFGSGFPKNLNSLKPAVECWWLVRKPLEGTVAANVLKHGVGGINIDECRVGTNGGSTQPSGMDRYNATLAKQGYRPKPYQKGRPPSPELAGRWPANLVLTHNSECEPNECVPGCPAKLLEEQNGSVSCFFNNFIPFRYSAKTSKSEKNAGLKEASLINKHPTVKSQDLMQHLIKLITPKGGTVLDPFAGSGSTLLAAISEGMHFIGIEQDPDYIAIAKQRLSTVGQEKLEDRNQQDLLESILNGEFDKEV